MYQLRRTKKNRLVFANEILNDCIENKVSLSPTKTSTSIIYEAIDNIDHNENIFSSKESSHYTIVSVFQNSDTSVDTDNVLQNSLNCNLNRSLSFKFGLDCQKVLPFPKLAREEITSNLKVGK